MRKGNPQAMSAEQQAQLQALDSLPNDQIDLSDMPEKLDWSKARRGVFYRPTKRQLTVRFDADVIEWFRLRGERGYQTRMNAVLREYMLAHHSEIDADSAATGKHSR